MLGITYFIKSEKLNSMNVNNIILEESCDLSNVNRNLNFAVSFCILRMKIQFNCIERISIPRSPLYYGIMQPQK